MIIGFFGARQSGKSTAVSYLLSKYLQQTHGIGHCQIMDNSDISYNCPFYDKSMLLKLNEFKYTRFSKGLVAPYAFADPLKEFCINVLGLTEEQCYGSDDDKNTLTNIKSVDIVSDYKHIAENGYGEYMTGRHVMQYFGTNMIRRMNSKAWANASLNVIKKDLVNIALISDGRFPNELQAIRTKESFCIRLLKNCDIESNHASENSLSHINNDEFDLVIDNRGMSMSEKHSILDKVYIDNIEQTVKLCK